MPLLSSGIKLLEMHIYIYLLFIYLFCQAEILADRWSKGVQNGIQISPVQYYLTMCATSAEGQSLFMDEKLTLFKEMCVSRACVWVYIKDSEKTDEEKGKIIDERQ